MLEDGGWAHWPGVWQTSKAPWQHLPSLANMVLELAMASASKRDIVRRVEITPTMVLIHRGDAKADGFSLASAFNNRGHEYRAVV